MTKKKFLIEAGSIAEKNMSGVGHTALYLIRSLAQDKKFTEEFEITLIVPFNKISLVGAHGLPRSIKIRRLFVPGKVMNGAVRFGIMPFMDIVFGRGVYLFPNFKNWPLLFSKNITYIHDVYFKIAPEHIEARNLAMLERHTNKFIRRADAVVTVSQHAKGEIEQFFPESRGKVRVVYNGIDHSQYFPRSLSEQDATATKYGLLRKKFFIFFSNIEPRKNIDTLLDAYKIFVDKTGRKDIALLLVGGMGWGNENTLAKIKDMKSGGYNIIKPSCYVPDSDMPALLSAAICLVHPALYEGFGLTPLESMACGTPVIVGDNSSLPEVMGKQYGHYVDIMNPSDIASEMRYHYKRQGVDQYGLQRSKKFSWGKSADALSRVVKEVDEK